MAMPNSHTLEKPPAITNKEGQNFVKPFEYFKPTAQAISRSPAITRISQAMLQKDIEKSH